METAKQKVAHEKILEKGIEFHREVKKTIVTAVTTAFALVIALFWQDAIKTGIEDITAFLGLSGETYIYKIITAAIVTIICVFAIMYLSRWQEKK
ncbi:MAG: DUF5654 family protein [Candidatus ainarchaeum sp.]|nr:DUF5654 family protein [Candidatus ainarchaeum sp.]